MDNKKLFKAIAGFQQEVPVIHKDTQGYDYTYADLPKIFEIINPLLKKHNLGFMQPIEGNSIKTIVFHTETGESIESIASIPQEVQLKGMNDFQVLGSAITYIRRYAISSMLGLVTDEDNDASGKQKEKPKVEQVKKTISDKELMNEIDLNPTMDNFTIVKKKYQLTEEQVKKLTDKFYEYFPETKK